MANESSAVLEYGVPEPSEMASLMVDKLRFHTDSWDLSLDLKSGTPRSSLLMRAQGRLMPKGTSPAQLVFRTVR